MGTDALTVFASSAGFTLTPALNAHWQRLFAQVAPLPSASLEPRSELPPDLLRYEAELTAELEQLGQRLRRDGGSALEAEWFLALTVLRWQRGHEARLRLRASPSWTGPLSAVEGGPRTPFTLTVRNDDWLHPLTQWVAIGPEPVQLHVQGERLATDGRWWAFKQRALGVQLDLVPRDGGFYCSLSFRRGREERQVSGVLRATKVMVGSAVTVLADARHEERVRARTP